MAGNRQLSTFSNTDSDIVSIQSFAGSVPDISPCENDRMWTPRWCPGINEQSSQFLPSLLLAMPLNEGNGTTVYDLSGNKFKGTMPSDTTGQWLYDSYLGVTFNRVSGDKFISVPTNYQVPQVLTSQTLGWTISVWFQAPPSVVTSDVEIVAGNYSPPPGGGGGAILGWRMIVDASIEGIQWDDYTGGAGVTSFVFGIGTPSPGQWCHVCLTTQIQSGAILQTAYINGQVAATSNPATSQTPSVFTSANNPIQIGGEKDNTGTSTGNNFHGPIRDFRLYAEPLTAGQIFNLWRYPDELYTQPTLIPAFVLPSIVTDTCNISCTSNISASAKVAHIATCGVQCGSSISAVGKDTGGARCVVQASSSMSPSAKVAHVIQTRTTVGNNVFAPRFNRTFPTAFNNQNYANLLNKKHNLANGLMLWYLTTPYTSRGYKWFDLTTRRNNGVFTNMLSAADRYKGTTHPGGFGSIHLTSTNNARVVSTTAELTGAGPFTASIWAKIENTSVGAFFQKTDLSGISGWWCQVLSGSLLFTISFDNNDCQRTYVPPAIGVWTHILCTWSGSTNSLASIRVYYNGILQSSTANSDGSGSHRTDAGNTLYVGTDSGLSRNLAGNVDDFRVYNRYFSSSEALQLYENSIQGYPGLINRSAGLVVQSQVTGPPTWTIVCSSSINPSATVSHVESTNNLHCSSNINVSGIITRYDTCTIACSSSMSCVAKVSHVMVGGIVLQNAGCIQNISRTFPAAFNNVDFSSVINRKHPLARGLVLWYLTLPQNSRGYKWYDLTGRNNHGALTNMIATGDGFKSISHKGGFGSMHLTSANSSRIVGSTNILVGTGPFTISFWIQYTTAGTVLYKTDQDTSAGWYCQISGSNFSFLVVFSAGDCSRTCAAPVAGVWTHVVCTWNGASVGTGINIYYNGSEQPYSATANPSGSHGSDNNQTLIVGSFNQASNFLGGYVNDIKVYNRFMKVGEALSLYTNSIQSYVGLLNRTSKEISIPRIFQQSNWTVTANSNINANAKVAHVDTTHVTCGSSINAGCAVSHKSTSTASCSSSLVSVAKVAHVATVLVSCSSNSVVNNTKAAHIGTCNVQAGSSIIASAKAAHIDSVNVNCSSSINGSGKVAHVTTSALTCTSSLVSVGKVAHSTTSTLSNTSSLVSIGQVAHIATVLVSCSSNSVVNNTKAAHIGTCNVQAGSSIIGSAKAAHVDTVNVNCSSSISANSNAAHVTTTVVACKSSISPAATVSHITSSNVSCSSNVFCNAKVAHIATVNMSCSCTMVVVPGNSAKILCGSSIIANATVSHIGTSSVSSSSFISANAKVAHIDTVNVKPSSSIIGSAKAAHVDSSNMPCGSSINAGCIVSHTGTATIACSSSLVSVGKVAHIGTVIVQAGSSIIASAKTAHIGTVNVQAGSSIIASAKAAHIDSVNILCNSFINAVVHGNTTDTCDILANSNISASAKVAHVSTALNLCTTSFAISSTKVAHIGTVIVQAGSSIIASAKTAHVGTVNVQAESSIIGSAKAAHIDSVSLLCSSSMNGSSKIAHVDTSNLACSSSLVSVAKVAHVATVLVSCSSNSVVSNTKAAHIGTCNVQAGSSIIGSAKAAHIDTVNVNCSSSINPSAKVAHVTASTILCTSSFASVGKVAHVGTVNAQAGSSIIGSAKAAHIDTVNVNCSSSITASTKSTKNATCIISASSLINGRAKVVHVDTSNASNSSSASAASMVSHYAVCTMSCTSNLKIIINSISHINCSSSINASASAAYISPSTVTCGSSIAGSAKTAHIGSATVLCSSLMLTRPKNNIVATCSIINSSSIHVSGKTSHRGTISVNCSVSVIPSAKAAHIDSSAISTSSNTICQAKNSAKTSSAVLGHSSLFAANSTFNHAICLASCTSNTLNVPKVLHLMVGDVTTQNAGIAKYSFASFNNVNYNGIIKNNHALSDHLVAWFLATPITSMGTKWYDLTSRQGNASFVNMKLDGYTPLTHKGGFGGIHFNSSRNTSANGKISNLTGTGPFTISLWINPQSSGTILYKTDQDTSAGWYCQTVGSNFSFSVVHSNIDCAVNCLSPKNGIWTHVSCVWYGGTSITGIKIYYNGVEQPHTSATDGSGIHKSDDGSPLIIGSFNNQTGTFFSGYLDDIKVYNKAIHPGNIQLIYENSISSYDGLLRRSSAVSSFSKIIVPSNWTLKCIVSLASSAVTNHVATVSTQSSAFIIGSAKVAHVEGINHISCVSATSCSSSVIHNTSTNIAASSNAVCSPKVSHVTTGSITISSAAIANAKTSHKSTYAANCSSAIKATTQNISAATCSVRASSSAVTSGRVSHIATCDVKSGSTLSPSATITHKAETNINSTLNISSNAKVNHVSTVALNGHSLVAANAKNTSIASVSIKNSSSFAINGIVDHKASINVTCSSSINIIAKVTHTSATAINISSNMIAKGKDACIGTAGVIASAFMAAISKISHVARSAVSLTSFGIFSAKNTTKTAAKNACSSSVVSSGSISHKNSSNVICISGTNAIPKVSHVALGNAKSNSSVSTTSHNICVASCSVKCGSLFSQNSSVSHRTTSNNTVNTNQNLNAISQHKASANVKCTSAMSQIYQATNNHIICVTNVSANGIVNRKLSSLIGSNSNFTASGIVLYGSGLNVKCGSRIFAVGSAENLNPPPLPPEGLIPDSISEENRNNPSAPEYNRPHKVQRSESWGAFQNGLPVLHDLGDKIYTPVPLESEKIVVERNVREE
jgi:hypothetical protein